MAITKLVSANTPNPVTLGEGGDWDLAMAQLTACKQVIQGQQMVLTEWTNVTTVPKLAEGSYLQHLGAVYIVDTEDYTIGTLTAGDVYYIQLAVDGDTLAVSFITDISGFSWNAQYNGLYDTSNNQMLPYTVAVSATATEFEKYKWLNVNPSIIVDYLGNINKDNDMSVGGDLSVGGNGSIYGSLSVAGALTGSTLDTGQGANELYPMNQGVRTTDAVQFDTVNTGNGANKVIKYSQDLAVYSDSSDKTVTLSSFELKEVRTVAIQFKSTSGDKDLKIYLPSGAETYSVVGTNIGAYYMSSWSESTSEVLIVSTSGGTKIVDSIAYSGIWAQAFLTIQRLS